MLTLSLARQLKNAGLRWQPTLHDAFVIPDRGLDERTFVITEVMAYIEQLWGSPMVTFHGTAEWALDYVLQTEAIWIPSESQLRELLAEQVNDLLLLQTAEGYECRFTLAGQSYAYESPNACDAYGSGLLQVLWQKAADPEAN